MGNEQSTAIRSQQDALIAAMKSQGADTGLLKTARLRFVKKLILLRLCDALERGLSNEEFGYWTQLEKNGLDDDDASVLAWFLTRNSSCTMLRRVTYPPLGVSWS